MSKGLEAFGQLLDCPTEIALIKKSGKPSGVIVRLKLINNGEYHEQLLAIEKELKAFEIIDKKSVVVELIRKTDDVGTYNFASKDGYHAIGLTEEEYDLLKEALS